MSCIALVTGAAQGIGRAIALRLAKDGFNVAVNDIEKNVNNLEKLKQGIENIGQQFLSIIGDVSQDKQCSNMYNKHLVVVANAGIAQVKPFIEITIEDWDKIFATNMRGIFLCYKEAAKIMIQQNKGGKIIGACSTAGYETFPLLTHYSATKWGVRGLTQVVARELAQYNINVNSYCPGITDTNMWNTIDHKVSKYQGKKKGEVTDEFVNNVVSLKRMGQPEDVANLVSYLASKHSDFITGHNIMINGGAACS